ncbi:MAG: hypothetical protein IM631_21595 [Cytophagales bacterium]|jgi:hypothetical protein|nr:hypothetical protein [Cytophagales bacterium]MCA6373958.1 hypothetical protein [Cytophagales bacterium]MCA6376447.1 hypothetical protein [Cytophagales bacterium]MCA6383867.1 hypothetical protein [Cytophagales bacterium]
MAWVNVSKRQKDKKFERAIVFVHGLNGNSSTWFGSPIRFADRIKTEREVCENFGLYIFEYHTKIFELTSLKKLLSLIPGLQKKEEFNVGIRRIAMELKSHLAELLEDYKTIVIVTHSMGGLVTKRAMVEIQSYELKKIKLFFSLSVPHHGASLAKIGTKLLGRNIQLIDLQSFSDFTNDLTNRFSNLKDKPIVIYQTGSQDKVVNEGSAVPAGVTEDYRIDTNDNHYTVLKISNPASHLPYRRLIRELKGILNLETQQSGANIANCEVTFSIPENWSFRNVAKELVESAKCTIEFMGFTNEELSIIIKSQELIQPNTFQALESLQYISLSPIPKYNIKVTNSHYEIIKI